MITNADLKPLVDAVPSFKSRWDAVIAKVDDPTLIGMEFSMALALHLSTNAANGNFDEFTGLFSALESSLSKGTGDLFDQLTMGFLESLIHAARRRHVDLSRIANHIKGPVLRREWNAAYAYTHHK